MSKPVPYFHKLYFYRAIQRKTVNNNQLSNQISEWTNNKTDKSLIKTSVVLSHINNLEMKF